jgi:hypothetical protein
LKTIEGNLANNTPGGNEPSAVNAGGFRRLAFTKLLSDGGKEKKQQANPALRLPVERWQ